jgi:diacylglycerol kinase family enzyme
VIDLLDVVLHTDDGAEWHGVSASNLAIGYPADVARLARGFRRLGAHSYTAAGLVARPRAFGAHVRVDDGAETRELLTGAIVSNSRYVGPFLGFPRASLSDGMFHTMTMRAGLARQLLHNLSSVTRLRFYEPGVTTDMRMIRLRFDAPRLVKIDGELREAVRAIDVRVLPRAATFRVLERRRG